MHLLERWQKMTGVDGRAGAGAAQDAGAEPPHLASRPHHRRRRCLAADHRHYVAELRGEAQPEWQPRLVESLRMIPNYYLNYFYNTSHKIAEQNIGPPRAPRR
jgi:hypothetical protein